MERVLTAMDDQGFKIYFAQRHKSRYYLGEISTYFLHIYRKPIKTEKILLNFEDLFQARKAEEFGLSYNVKPIYREPMNKKQWNKLVEYIRTKWNNAEVVFTKEDFPLIKIGIKMNRVTCAYGSLKECNNFISTESFNVHYASKALGKYFPKIAEEVLEGVKKADIEQLAEYMERKKVEREKARQDIIEYFEARNIPRIQ